VPLATLEEARSFLERQLTGPVAGQPWVQHVEHDPEIDRWYVRFGCDGRDAATIYFDLRQRSLYHELYFMPAPDAGADGTANASLWEWLALYEATETWFQAAVTIGFRSRSAG
jgi:hypothetical protein